MSGLFAPTTQSVEANFSPNEFILGAAPIVSTNGG